MEYSKLSDFEINNLVDGHIYKDPSEAPDTDYCNNPADAWSIIVENKISISNCGAERWTANDVGIDNLHKDKNPLRAAMIVFLMMQESQHA
ncbi:phage protein NinX family protein [Cronobacter malonaticus]